MVQRPESSSAAWVRFASSRVAVATLSPAGIEVLFPGTERYLVFMLEVEDSVDYTLVLIPNVQNQTATQANGISYS